MFYLAKMFTADLRRGEAYKNAKKCIAITILDFNLDEREAYHNTYALRDKSGILYTDIIEPRTIELKKKPNKDRQSPLDEWHRLFNAKTEEDLDMIKAGTKNKGIIEAVKELKEISLADRLRYEHESRLKVKRDREAEMEYAYEQGQESGIREGREDEREENIKILVNTLRECSQSDEMIAKKLMEKYGLTQEQAEGKL